MNPSSDSLIEWSDLSIAEKAIIQEKSESSFLEFTRLWFQIMQGDKLLVNWHHELMADRVDDLIAGRNNNSLAINIPPGGTIT